MRLILDSLIAVMLAIILGGLMLHQHNRQQKEDRHQSVHIALAQLHDSMLYRAAIREVSTTSTGFPVGISPLWFEHELVPTNDLVPGRQPWIDLAPPGDMADHPPDPVIVSGEQAGFWYNPNRGIIRARVAPQLSDAATVQVYNASNGVALPNFKRTLSDNPQRRPQPMPMVVTSAEGDPTTRVQAAPPARRLLLQRTQPRSTR